MSRIQMTPSPQDEIIAPGIFWLYFRIVGGGCSSLWLERKTRVPQLCFNGEHSQRALCVTTHCTSTVTVHEIIYISIRTREKKVLEPHAIPFLTQSSHDVWKRLHANSVLTHLEYFRNVSHAGSIQRERERERERERNNRTWTWHFVNNTWLVYGPCFILVQSVVTVHTSP